MISIKKVRFKIVTNGHLVFDKLVLFLWSCFSLVIPFIFMSKVFLDWNDLSLVIRSKVFEKDEMEQIDIHDVKVLIITCTTYNVVAVIVVYMYVRLHLHI